MKDKIQNIHSKIETIALSTSTVQPSLPDKSNDDIMEILSSLTNDDFSDQNYSCSKSVDSSSFVHDSSYTYMYTPMEPVIPQPPVQQPPFVHQIIDDASGAEHSRNIIQPIIPQPFIQPIDDTPGPSKPMQPFVPVLPPFKQSIGDSSGHKLKTVNQIITDKPFLKQIDKIGHLTIELAVNHIFGKSVLLSSTISGRNLNALDPVKLSELKYAVKFVMQSNNIINDDDFNKKWRDVCLPSLANKCKKLRQSQKK